MRQYQDATKTMNRILQNIFKSENREDRIRNSGLKLALRWGDEWMQPIQERLKQKFPNLTSSELDEHDLLCTQARNHGQNYIFDTLRKATDDGIQLSEKAFKKQFKDFVKNTYPWVNNSNLNSIFSQGMYYAWKDGFDRCLK